MKAVLCRVTGRVQSVWFRGNAKQQADRLGVTGYAKNLPDGSVEVLACGEDAAVDTLVEWLHRGPVLAKVANVDITPAEPTTREDFAIL